MVTPVLDLMQTMPAFCYLAPIALFFGIGASAARRADLHLRAPAAGPDHRARRSTSVPATTVEAARSMGLTERQMLRQVQLPMARRTIVVGINQCMMAALSMATIAALVNGPGLGKPVVAALQVLNVGAAVGRRPRDRADGDHARPHHHGRERALQRPHRRRLGERPGRDDRGVVLERLPRWATEDAGKGQRLPAADQGRTLAAAGAAAHPGRRSASGCPATTSTWPSSRTRARPRS